MASQHINSQNYCTGKYVDSAGKNANVFYYLDSKKKSCKKL